MPAKSRKANRYESVRDEPKPTFGRHHEDACELRRPGIVYQSGTNDLTEAVSEHRSRNLDPLLLRDSEPGDLRSKGDPYDKLRPPRR